MVREETKQGEGMKSSAYVAGRNSELPVFIVGESPHKGVGEKTNLGKTVGKTDFSVAGKYSVDIDTKDLEAGVYYLTFTSDGYRRARKLVVVK